MASTQAKPTLDDFTIKRRLGEGSYSIVVLAEDKRTGQEVALKIVDQQFVVRHNMAEYIRQERDLLIGLNHPGVSKLHFTFRDNTNVYLGLELCPNGELLDQINQKGGLDVRTAKFYAAEVVDVLQYLRTKSIVHRDVKPENLLLDLHGHLKLVDFGSAKHLTSPLQHPQRSHPLARRSTPPRSTSFVGTAEYVAPEVLRNEGVSYATDLWSLGCIVYQMFTQSSPFRAGSEYLTYEKISAGLGQVPENLPRVAAELVRRLLVQDPKARLGATDIEELKAHEFFEGIVWEELRSGPAPAFDTVRPLEQDEYLQWELQGISASLQQPETVVWVPSE